MAAVKFAPNGDLPTVQRNLSNKMRSQQNTARATALEAIGAPDDLGVVLPRGLEAVLEAQSQVVALYDQYLRETAPGA